MPTYYRYRISSGHVEGATVQDEQPSSAEVFMAYTPADPPTPNGNDLGIPKIYAGGIVRNATQQEIDSFPTFAANDVNLGYRAEAESITTNPDGIAKYLRAFMLVVLEEFNRHRGDFIGGAQANWDPANMANGSGVTSPELNVAGAQFGDVVVVSAPYTLNGIVATGYVSSANNVQVRVHNSTGGAQNLGPGQWRVGVWRPVSRPQLTVNDLKQILITKLTNGDAD